MMAGGRAASLGAEVILLEKKDRPGRKLHISGKGRCNITNTAPAGEMIANFPDQGRFLYGAFSAFSNRDLVEFMKTLGVETKVERGGRVFPVSDRAEEVVEALVAWVRRCGVTLMTDSPVEAVLVAEGDHHPGSDLHRAVQGVRLKSGRTLEGRAAILATGGASYPGTGSTGDGYAIARALGHTVIPIGPSLVPLEIAEDWVRDVQGLALKNVEAALTTDRGEVLGREFGEMLFTHFGVSGPIILTLSREAGRRLRSGSGPLRLRIDLKPALDRETLDDRLQRDFLKYQRKLFKNALDDLLPKSLIPVIVRRSEISPEKPVHQITREERLRLVELLKGLPLTVLRTRSLAEAIVTAGGVCTKEINPKTMESKLVRGLFLAGEVIDVDAYTGGFNLQAAFSTGYVAGTSAVRMTVGTVTQEHH